jgi:hypothetical protein
MRKWQRQPFTPRSRGRGLSNARPQWDFSGYNSVTTEAIPPFGGKDRMRWYQGSVHLSQPRVARLWTRSAGFPPSELAKDQTFGVQVKPANIEEHFERGRIARERHIAANTETEGVLSRQASVPRRTGFSCGPPKLCAVILAKGEIKMQQG